MAPPANMSAETAGVSAYSTQASESAAQAANPASFCSTKTTRHSGNSSSGRANCLLRVRGGRTRSRVRRGLEMPGFGRSLAGSAAHRP